MRKKSIVVLSSLALLVLLISFLASQKPAIAANESLDRLVTVNGQGTMKIKPDQSIITLGVQTIEATAKESSEKNAKIMEDVYDALIKASISKENISTKGYRLYQVYDYVDGERISKGYQATNTIEFKTKELDSVGEYVDIAIKAGANDVNNIRFTVEDQEEVKLKLLELAVKNATKKANVLTKAAGASRGRVASITENSVTGPFYREADYMMTMDNDNSKSITPIQADDIELTANVTVAFAIQ